MIPLFQPSHDRAEAEAVSRVLTSHWLGRGKEVAEFEKEFAAYLKLPSTQTVISTNSCTSALVLALKALKIGPGDDVIVPTLTFVATAQAVYEVGANPIFSDIDGETLMLTPKTIEEVKTDKTKAVISVNLYGRQNKAMRGYSECPVIEDCAHSAGATLNCVKSGASGNIACFSFHAVKNLSCGDGGAVVLPSELAEWARSFSWHGISKNTFERTTEQRYKPDYDLIEVGKKLHWNDLLAAVGREQLRKLYTQNHKRKVIAEYYTLELATIAELILPAEDTLTDVSSWHIYAIMCPRRNELKQYLSERGICTGIHYRPLHTFAALQYDGLQLIEAEAVYAELLSLPMFPDMSLEQFQTVVAAIKEFYK